VNRSGVNPLSPRGKAGAETVRNGGIRKPRTRRKGTRRKGSPNQAVIAFGSNIDPEVAIGRAASGMARFLAVLASSDVVTTRPIGNPNQPDFMNGVVLVETRMNRNELVERLHGLESELGRVRTGDRYGPRSIDLDVVWWNGRICHPDVRERPYLADALRQVLAKVKGTAS
jgi:2-amino-4-hydroxy-6-hydroxymethyldihydropteridine diphosphokinase